MTRDGLRSALAESLGSSYKLDHELVGGGMSRVFTARDEQLGRDVVVKVLSPELATGLKLDRFAKEIRLIASLREPHIVPVLGAGVTSGGLPYYIMPYMRGESLRARMGRERIPVSECIGVLRDVARALSYAHRQGVIHRDIKPENVLMSYGSAVVTDFGILKAITSARPRRVRAEMLAHGEMSLGTPAYMAPEQATGDELDARSDLYSWGVMAYEMLSGEHPFPGQRTHQQYFVAHTEEAPVHLMLRMPGAPVALCELVMRCLEKIPVERPVAATELVRLLDDPALMVALPTPREEARASARGRRQRYIAIGAAVLVMSFVFGSPLLLARVRNLKAPSDIAVMAPEGTPLTTLVVLPFASDESDDAQNAYLADGMADELAHALARLADIRVVGRASSWAHGSAPINVLEIGKALNVGSVITGNVQREGNRLRVSVHVMNANDGLVLWSDQFDRPLAAMFSVQDEVTRKIVEAIAPKLRGAIAASAAAASRGTGDLVAYDLLMHGRSYLAMSDSDSIAAAIPFFQRAIATDSTFARAHAYLAMSYVALADASGAPTDSGVALAMAEARRALALDNTSADAHLAMALALNSSAHYSEAEAHFATALRRMPGDATTHQRHAENLSQLGRANEALAEIQRALELDPVSPVTRQSRMGIELAMRKYDDAIADGERIAATDSTLVKAQIMNALALALNDRPDSASRVLNAVSSAHPRFPGLRGTRLFAYATAGRWNEASRMKDVIADSRPRSDYDAMVSAIVFGDNRRALYLLEQAGTHASDIPSASWSIPCSPVFDPIKKEPRFIAFVQAHGMTICPITTSWPIMPRLITPVPRNRG